MPSQRAVSYDLTSRLCMFLLRTAQQKHGTQSWA